MKIAFFIASLLLMLQVGWSQHKQVNPICKVDIANPTKDKPQSKLFFIKGSWYAILPTTTGPTLWKRTVQGWIPNKNINEKLKGLAAQVDTYVDGARVYVVGVEPYKLAIFCLEYLDNSTKEEWKLSNVKEILLKEESAIETATITLDTNKTLWVAGVAGNKVTVWSSPQYDTHWSGPIILASDIGKDDICTIVKETRGVRVIWSDQLNQAVKTRLHITSKDILIWEEEAIIAQGNKTADDHLNTVVTANGTLWVATKNSVDKVGKPQFVMRILDATGNWKNYPYCNLETTKSPTRPIVVSVANHSSLVLTGYTIFNHQNPELSTITFAKVTTTTDTLLEHIVPVIAGTQTSQINNVTGPKDPFPEKAPWIVLASDKEGNVYETDLSLFFKEYLVE